MPKETAADLRAIIIDATAELRDGDLLALLGRKLSLAIGIMGAWRFSK